MKMARLEPWSGRADPRSTVGGRPWLEQGRAWPLCRTHQVPQVLFFQIDAADGGPPLRAGEHLAIFQCPCWNDIPDLAPVLPGQPLPELHWERGEGHYAFVLSPAGAALTRRPFESHLQPSALAFSDTADERARGFKVGGAPSWAQHPEVYRCGCGAELEFLAQVPLDFAFTKAPGAPDQPNTYSRKKYLLFLGNETYLFACRARCHPQAVWAVVQN